QAARRLGHVVEAEPGVDQHQAVVALDAQHVPDDARLGAQAALAGDEAGAARAHVGTVEVVDAHVGPTLTQVEPIIVPERPTLTRLREGAATCRACPLYQ